MTSARAAQGIKAAQTRLQGTAGREPALEQAAATTEKPGARIRCRREFQFAYIEQWLLGCDPTKNFSTIKDRDSSYIACCVR